MLKCLHVHTGLYLKADDVMVSRDSCRGCRLPAAGARGVRLSSSSCTMIGSSLREPAPVRGVGGATGGGGEGLARRRRLPPP